MNHKQKVKMARKMMTAEERKTKHGKTIDGKKKGKTPIFQSAAWKERRNKKKG